MSLPSGLGFALAGDPLDARIRQRKRPVQERSKSTVESIGTATLQVLVRDGYRRLTTVRVAERAGVSVGTLYQYFPNKRSLVTALKVHYVRTLMERITAASRAACGKPLETAAREMIEALLAAKRENLALTLALREPMAELGGDELMREATARLIDSTAAMLEAALPGLRDARAIAATVVAAVDGVVSSVVFQKPEQLEKPELADDLVALVVGYVRARSSS